MRITSTGITAQEIWNVAGTSIPLTTILNAIAADTLRTSSDTAVSGSSTSYIKIKAITVVLPGVYRVCFGLYSETAGSMAYGKIYKNGVAYGTERTNNTTSEITFTEDFSLLPGDKVELWIRRTTTLYGIKGLNFRVYCDFVAASMGTSIPVVTYP